MTSRIEGDPLDETWRAQVSGASLTTIDLGPLPSELMEYGHAGVGLLAVSREREAATAFIKFMTDPANTALLRKGSMEPPER